MLSVSDKLIVFQKLVSCASPILFAEYDARTFLPLSDHAQSDAILYFFFSMDNGDGNWWNPDGPNFKALGDSGTYRPIVCTNSLGMVWIAEIEALDRQPYRLHTIGPVFVNDYSIQSITNSLAKHELSDEVRRNVMDFIHSIPVIYNIRLYEYGLMLHWCLTGEQISLSDLTYLDSGSPAPAMSQDSATSRHGTYLAEQRMLRSVRDGNLEYRKEMDKFASAGNTGQFISRNGIRYMKNYVIIYTALCCRAAVQGGLDVETAYALSDQYLESIENADNLFALQELISAMVKDYIERVRRAKSADSLPPQIRMACEWITLEPAAYNIHTLAEKLGYTDYYFSKLFKRETGKSVNEYILAQKIEAAKQLLLSTPMSVAEIADQLGMESQSYFTASFRKATGVTPREYRSTQAETTALIHSSNQSDS